MKALFTILTLLVLSDGVAAFIGGRSAWAMRDEETGKHLELAIAFAIGLFCYSVARFAAVVNSVFNGEGLVLPPRYLGWAIGVSCLQSIGVWTMALTLLNGRAPGTIQRALSWMLSKLR